MRLFEILGSMFVIGDPSIYDPLLAKNRLRKAGKDFQPGYPGGTVYTSLPAAVKAARRHRYGVYRLGEPYHKDAVYAHPETGEYHLTNGMKIIKRINLDATGGGEK